MQSAASWLMTLVSAIAMLAPVQASAGYWEVVYDLAPDSELETINPLGPDIDPISGTLTVRYAALSEAAPLSGALLMGGNTFVDIDQPVPNILTITGETSTELLPPESGTPGEIVGRRVTFEQIEDSSTTGYLHCYGPLCGAAGFIASQETPQTPTGPGPFPFAFKRWVFTSDIGGVGDWAAPTATETVVAGGVTVTIKTTYVGREISRTFVPEPTTGFAWLAACGGLCWLRRRTP